MLLTLTSTHEPADDLSYLLHKHPSRFQTFELSFGQAHVFYPAVGSAVCTACLLVDVDPISLTRRHRQSTDGLLAHYVNDRPYAASSLLSVAISQVFGSAMAGRCDTRPGLAETLLPLTARIEALPARGGQPQLARMFEPLGYQLAATGQPLDERFPDWGESPYYCVTISKLTTLRELLTHLYVLIPVFDNQKHYFVGEDELEKLLRKGEGWLADHPAKEEISRRYLRHRASLYRTALARLAEVDDAADPDEQLDRGVRDEAEAVLEKPLSLHEQRIAAVLAELRASGGKSVLDLGCGEGRFLRELLREPAITRIVGLDVSAEALRRAGKRLGLDRLPAAQRSRLELLHGSLIYRDKRLQGFDAAALVEVIEHLDPPRLRALERVVFEFAQPKTVVVTTPNAEYNVMWPALSSGAFRHADHRFEWTRAEFAQWARNIAERFSYRVRIVGIGPDDPAVGCPTQMGIFERG